MQRVFKLMMPLVGKWRFWLNILLGIFSGLCSFLFINLVTNVTSLIIEGHFTQISREYIILFAGIILLYIWARRGLAVTIIEISQKLFWSLRRQILSLVLKADHLQLSARKTQVHSAIVSDVNILTQTSLTLIDFFTSSIMAIACLVYMATISIVLFGITLGVALLGVTVYHFSARHNLRQFEKARQLENGFLKHLNAILDGFKEIYMTPAKGQAIYNRKVAEVAEQAYRNNITAFTGFVNNQITGQVLFYLLLSSILLFFSITLHIKAGNTVRFIFVLLYLLSAIEMIMALLPGLARAKVAANHLADLKEELEQAGFDSRKPEQHIGKHSFKSIRAKALEFHYGKEAHAFRVGPVDFTAEKGELIFIYGGNGSGKTTFMNALIGLSTPSAGQICLNDTPVEKDNYPEYRTVFSVVFSDFYLFDEWLGDAAPDMERWHHYLQLFELEGKVTLEGRQLSTTSLSTGQRKRLTLILTLLEDKPVLVLDEWAADQDPYFRKKFYTEILPQLKKEGITVIAITHDDRYYHCADKLYKMESGKLLPEGTDVYLTGHY